MFFRMCVYCLYFRSEYQNMTKRKNPFDDCYILQKMHVGVKEVNLGVNHVENMKKVYG